jgi:DNA polymerase-3 subunit delta
MLRALASSPLLPAYLLFGEESYLVDRALTTVCERLRGGTAVARLRADEDRLIARVEEALRTPSLFGGAASVVLNDVDALDEKTQEQVLELLESDAGGHLVMVGASPDMRRRLFASCTRKGWAFGFRRLPAARIPAWLREEAAQRGHPIATEAVALLAELAGPDLRAATGEIEKLSLFVGEGQPIDATAVAAVVGPTRARSVFELGTMVQERQIGHALALVRRLLGQGEAPIAIAAFLAAQLRRMLVARSLIARRRGAEVAGRLGVSPWVAERIVGGARRYDGATLQRALARVAAVDVALKSTRASGPVLIETCLLELDARR